jgi:hypothetical protein
MSFEKHILYEDSEQSALTAEPKVELVFQNESGCGYSDPFVAVMVNDVQRDKVWAYVGMEKGADGGWYNVVKFRRSSK